MSRNHKSLIWLFLFGLGAATAVFALMNSRPANQSPNSPQTATRPSDSPNTENVPQNKPAPLPGEPPLAFLASYTPPVFTKNPGYVGPDTCKECHQEIFQTASLTNHFRACRAVTPDDMPKGFQEPQSNFISSHGNTRFQMRQEGDSFWMDTFASPEASTPVAQSRLDLVLGSGGKFDDVFLSWKDDGWMTELPMAWLYPTNQWATSHFNPYSPGDHSRPLTVRCLECHNTWVQHVTGTANQYMREGAILGVTCESCHGPGQSHVSHYRNVSQNSLAPSPDSPKAASGTPYDIIVPNQLDREQRIALCSQCHSNTMKRRELAFSHSPDVPIENSFHELSSQFHEDDHVANQTRFMRESKCFQNDTQMTCITCHSPHETPSPTVSHSQSCSKCHQPEACTDRSNLPEPIRDQCVECHMPPFIKINVNFQTESDNFVTPIRRWQHKIGIYPEARKELMRDYLQTLEDTESQKKAKELTTELVNHYLAQADDCSQSQRFVGAIAAAREALRISDTPQVRTKLEKAIEVQTQLESLRATANQLLGSRQFAQAIPVLQEILSRKTNDAIANGRLGTCFAETGNTVLAKEFWKKVVLFDPDDAYGIGMLAWTAYREGNLDDALTLYLQADEIEPYEAKVKFQIGMILARQGKLEEAKQFFENALSIEPLNPGALQAQIGLLRQLGDSAAALPLAQTAVVLTGLRDPDALMVLAETSAEIAQFREAIEAARLARQVSQQAATDLVPRIDQRIRFYESQITP